MTPIVVLSVFMHGHQCTIPDRTLAYQRAQREANHYNHMGTRDCCLILIILIILIILALLGLTLVLWTEGSHAIRPSLQRAQVRLLSNSTYTVR